MRPELSVAALALLLAGADGGAPAAPDESCRAADPPAGKPVHLDVLTAKPKPCTRFDQVPDKAQLQRITGALAANARQDGALEVPVLPDGCARLIERRAGGEVRRWELQRKLPGGWTTTVTWELDRGVRRPSTLGPFSLFTDLNQQGEWARDEVHRKRFTRVSPDGGLGDTTVITHYRGETAIEIKTAEGTGREASDRSTPRCRSDGTGHCDNLQRDQFWYLEGTPY